ncbi:triose-phosphate isomerase [Candidatus Nanosalina sp. VS9-1]|uniref:triose-phosphate isomerase n=1 Tax=Candidatus Nanosalina sp. VS9-1 TaxID=3388566 RepID=UPI0039E1AF1B
MNNRIIVNFKAYRNALGDRSEELVKSFSEVYKEIDGEVIVAPSSFDTFRTAGNGIKIYSQHVGPLKPGSHTGHSVAEAVEATGASGSLINHSERRMDSESIEDAVSRCEELGLETVVCAQTVEEVEEYSSFRPDFIAFEPPELIGGDTAVSQAEPEMIREAVESTADGVETLTGAGIKSAEDVSKSIELGCSGVLVASGIVKSDNPAETLEKMCEGL